MKRNQRKARQFHRGALADLCARETGPEGVFGGLECLLLCCISLASLYSILFTLKCFFLCIQTGKLSGMTMEVIFRCSGGGANGHEKMKALMVGLGS